MKLPTYYQTVAAGIVASLFGPACWWLSLILGGGYIIGAVLSPGFLLLAALIPPHEVVEGDGGDIVLILWALVTNALVYVVAFSLLWGIAWFISARFRSSRTRQRSNQAMQRTAGRSDV